MTKCKTKTAGCYMTSSSPWLLGRMYIDAKDQKVTEWEGQQKFHISRWLLAICLTEWKLGKLHDNKKTFIKSGSHPTSGPWEIVNVPLRGHMQNTYQPVFVQLFLSKRASCGVHIKDYLSFKLCSAEKDTITSYYIHRKFLHWADDFHYQTVHLLIYDWLFTLQTMPNAHSKSPSCCVPSAYH